MNLITPKTIKKECHETIRDILKTQSRVCTKTLYNLLSDNVEGLTQANFADIFLSLEEEFGLEKLGEAAFQDPDNNDVQHFEYKD